MINIPTEMLRTLVAVVDHRSFTKAAMSLGVTQPAVSAQIKRLQFVLGIELFDKNSAGIVLTRGGNEVITYARRLLSINDQIVKIAAPDSSDTTIKIGTTGDYFSPYLPEVLARVRQRWPHHKFALFHGQSIKLLQQLRNGELDLVISFTPEKPELDAHYHWVEELVWVRGHTMPEPLPELIPLVARNDHWMSRGTAIAALEKVSRPFEVILSAPTVLAMLSSVRAGIGIMPFAKRRIGSADLAMVQDPTMPKLPDVVCSICVREGGDAELLDYLTTAIAEAIRPEEVSPGGPAMLAAVRH
jgi:DNA-binding transcriptional LysR family regulator